MTIKVNFFNNTEYEYYAEDFNRQFMYLVSTNGVADKNSFPVGPQGTPNGTVTVGTGAAWWNGQFIYSDSAEILSITPNETLEERIDCVVLNIDKLNLNASLEVVTKGLTTDDMIILAEINMPGSTSIVTQGQITDKRSFVTLKDELVQKFHDFFKNGGEIGGIIKSTKGLETNSTTHNESARLLMENGQVALRHYIENSQASNMFVHDVNDKSTLFYGDVNIKDGASKNLNGYTKLPNGMIMQWGYIDLLMSDNYFASSVVSFPIIFPSRVVSITANPIKNISENNAACLEGILAVAEIIDNHNFYLTLKDVMKTVPNNTTVFRGTWIAIGY